MQKVAANIREIRQWWFSPIDLGEMRHGALISIWVRWLVLVACLVEINYRADYLSTTYWLLTLYNSAPMIVNAWVHYRVQSNQSVTWPWLLVLSAMDITLISGSLALSGGFESNMFVLYYPAIAMFAAIFTASRVVFVWTSLMAIEYTVLSLEVGTGVNFEELDDKVLYTRIGAMYAVAVAVNLVTRFDRVRRNQAVGRERQLQSERVELSQTIHDTVAQSAYLTGLGIQTAIELADKSNRELVASLEATYAQCKSVMWELRHPVDIGLIFEGRQLSRVLQSHVATFATISSVPTELKQSGREPRLGPVVRGLLFSIAHNAMTNALRHSGASHVVVKLDFGATELQMAISDDGKGLPEDYSDRGHGFRNMRRDAERIGGRLDVESGGREPGTTVICVVPYGQTLVPMPSDFDGI